VGGGGTSIMTSSESLSEATSIVLNAFVVLTSLD
jgi:hypothetical protein